MLAWISGSKPIRDVLMEFGDDGKKIIAVNLTADDLSFINLHLGRALDDLKENGGELSESDKILGKIWMAAKGKQY